MCHSWYVARFCKATVFGLSNLSHSIVIIIVSINNIIKTTVAIYL